MTSAKDLLAYCGFYCGDCLGHTGVIAEAAEAFRAVLETYEFDRTAEAIFPTQLKDYGKLHEMLTFMTGLRCPKVCRDREGESVFCEVRSCCRSKGFFACHQCSDFEICEKLKALHGGLHYAASLKNLRAIRQMGLEAWIKHGKRHCYWDEKDDR